MTDTLRLPRRRGVLALLASLPVAARSGNTHAAPAAGAPIGPTTIDAATVLVGGPDGGPLDRWGRVVQPALAQALPPETALTRASVGGPDGVTAANRFATRGDPDGRTVLLAPGDAAIAWLVGDPRAKYDLGRWTSVMVCLTPGVLMVRPGALKGKQPVRIGVPALASTTLAGVMALELLGAAAEPVIGLPATGRSAPTGAPLNLAAAFGAGTVDAVLARGHHVDEQVRVLIQAGARPLLALGGRTETGQLTRDEAFPTVPILTEMTSTTGPMLDAFHAAAIAARLEFALVLPQLTPAGRVALWRQAAHEATGALDVQALALLLGARPMGGAEASANAGAVAASQPALLALRRWLGTRYHWKPA
jgi:hypothetical protein